MIHMMYILQVIMYMCYTYCRREDHASLWTLPWVEEAVPGYVAPPPCLQHLLSLETLVPSCLPRWTRCFCACSLAREGASRGAACPLPAPPVGARASGRSPGSKKRSRGTRSTRDSKSAFSKCWIFKCVLVTQITPQYARRS